MDTVINRFLQTLIVAAPMVIVAPYVAAETHPTQRQMQQNINAVLKITRNTSLTEAQHMKQVEQYASRYLDYERISTLAVGAPWREFSARQKTDFIRTFKDMIIAMYSHSALISAVDANVRLLSKMTTNGNKFDVLSEIQTKKGTKYEMAYQPYQSGGMYKIYNIRVDGTSLVTAHRNQFGELIKSKGIGSTITIVAAKGLKKQ